MIWRGQAAVGPAEIVESMARRGFAASHLEEIGPRRPFGLRWVFGVSLLAVIAGLTLLAPVLVLASLGVRGGLDAQLNSQAQLALVFAGAVLAYAASAVLLPRWFLHRRRSLDLLRWRRPQRCDFGWALLGAGLSWAGLIGYDALAGGFAPDSFRPAPLVRYEGVQVQIEWLAAAAFLSIITAPIAEETFFRGFLLGGLRRARRLRLALPVSALLFGAAHLTLPVLIPFTLTGAVFGLLYIRTRCLTAPTLAHCGHNAAAFAVFLWSVGVI